MNKVETFLTNEGYYQPEFTLKKLIMKMPWKSEIEIFDCAANSPPAFQTVLRVKIVDCSNCQCLYRFHLLFFTSLINENRAHQLQEDDRGK